MTVVDVPFTQFVDFFLKTGTDKIKLVRNVIENSQTDYDPKRDFYRRIREVITSATKDGEWNRVVELSEGTIHDSLLPLANNKIPSYKKVAKGILAIRQDEFGSGQWGRPIKEKWTHDNLHIKVNPELAFMVGERHCLIKLYFKQPPCPDLRIKMILNIMRDTFPPQYTCCLADLPRGKLHMLTESDRDLRVLSGGEAASFLLIHQQLMLENQNT